MSTNILFVFEGAKTEYLVVKSLEKYVLNESTIIKCAYTSDIYQLYRETKDDDDLDIFSLIKERDVDNPIFKEYNRDNFSEIYLFFDYDAHASLAIHKDPLSGKMINDGDEQIKQMLAFFDNETEKGKLYISYPMVEAIRHIVDNYEIFRDLKVKCKGNNCQYKVICNDKEVCKQEPHYKTRVATESIKELCNYNKYSLDTWKNLTRAHLRKMNYIVNDAYTFPLKIESQLNIFAKQLEKYINHKCPMVGVLSAFPVFVFDYYGYERTRNILNIMAENNDPNSIKNLY